MIRVVPFLVLLGLAGCAGQDLTPDEREYQRVEWLETEWKPFVAQCYRQNFILAYQGPQNRRLRRELEDGNFERWRKIDTVYIHCVDPERTMRVLGSAW